MRALSFGIVLLLAGCTRVSTSYTPAKSEYASGAPQSVPVARVAYEGDLPELVECGGEVLGSMAGSGNRWAGQGDVEERIRRKAAERGATHVVFVSAHEEEGRTPVVYHTQCTKWGCTTTPSGGYRYTKPRAGYVLVRVPQSRWEELSPALGGLGKKPAPPPPDPVAVAAAPISEATGTEELAPSPADSDGSTSEFSESERRNCYRRTRAIFGTAASELDPGSDSEGQEGSASWATSYTTGKRPDQAQHVAEQSKARQEEAAAWFDECLAGKKPENTNPFSVR